MSDSTPSWKRRRIRARSSILGSGEAMIWLTGGMLALSLLMIGGLLALVLGQGLATFWPTEVTRIETRDGAVYMGEITRSEQPDTSEHGRQLMRTGNFRLTQKHFEWVSDDEIVKRESPEWAVVAERLEWGRFYGFPVAYVQITSLDGVDPDELEARLRREGATEVGAVARDGSGLALAPLESIGTRRIVGLASVLRGAERAWGAFEQHHGKLDSESPGRHHMLFRSAGEGHLPAREVLLPLDQIVRAYRANHISTPGALGIYGARWFEFLTAEPREANSEGGVFPAIFGTIVMTLVMSIVVVPFGVLTALYLREYAKPGLTVSMVRIAVNNLAGVPSIVFGVFGLGFFCYLVGSTLDELLFSAQLPNPTYGKGGLLWASLTLALLTLPVVIVATEEALAAVPNSMREGSYACGASKWQTIRRIVLPRAMPGIITGMILAIARGAGEVAPLMLVGAVKLAPELPIDGILPFIHPQRSFMHLGFHIYDVGFQSQNSEAAKPMVYTTTLLLIAIVALLNFAAVWLRRRLRRRFMTSQF